MSDSLIINIENHRSRDRIKELGEVFTPEQYVQKMLKLFDSKVWTDENVIFFEPSAGHGNIVVPILEKRIASLRQKYVRDGSTKPTLRAIANALNRLWAIDICPLNIELTRKRVFTVVLEHIKDQNPTNAKTRDFLAHVLCTIAWQITENEALSSLSSESNSLSNANKTKSGSVWYRRNQHKRIDFQRDWCEFFRNSQEGNVVPVLFLRALRFVDATLIGSRNRGFEEFSFAREALQKLSGEPAEAAKDAAS